MKTEQWVLIVGGKVELAIKAKALGLRVIQLQEQAFVEPEQPHIADHVVITNFNHRDDLINLAGALHTAIPFNRVVSLSEDALVPAAEICSALKLPGVAAKPTYLLKNKLAMRQQLAAAGISPVTTATGHTLIDLQNFLQRCSSDIIAKPIDAAGSLGVFRIHNKTTAEHAYTQLAAKGLVPFIMEEYLEGIEVSVETFSFNGKHVVITITDKLVGPNFIEIGHTIPSQLNLSQQTEIIKLTKDFLDVIGLTDGPSHTEIKLTPHGARIIESHNRVGGDHINELIQLAFGIDMKQMTIAWQFGLIEPLHTAPAPQHGAAIHFFISPPGIVQSISGFDEIMQAEGVMAGKLTLKVGDQVRPLTSSTDRVGYLLVQGQDAQQARNYVNQLARAVNIVVTT